MTAACLCHPDGARLIVDAVPNTTAAGDLILPLFEHLAANLTRR